MKLTDEQFEIAEDIVQSDRFRQSLVGLAGTGKTTVSKYIYDRWTKMGVKVGVLAPTGKASMVLRSKGVPATTIHKAIYNFMGKKYDEDDVELIFKEKGYNATESRRFIVDESSMVTQRQLEDIERLGIPTLWVGDPGQLPPVRATKTDLLTKPSHTLRTIHRQAAQSPIIQFAHKLRGGAALTDRFSGIGRVDCSGRGPLYVAAAMLDRNITRMIVKTNAQRVALNEAVRTLQGRSGVIQAGEAVITLLNDWDYDVINGETFVVEEVVGSQSGITDVLAKSVDVGYSKHLRLLDRQFSQLKTLDKDDLDDTDCVLADYASALTCHKMQGSSSPNIGIVAKGYCGEDIRRWNYTAATRAEEEVTVFC
jgi:exodeoxyribonuclease-5